MATRFGLDVDGVLYKWEDTVRYLLERRFGLKVEPSKGWNDIQGQCTNNQWQWLWSQGVRDGMFRHGSLYRGGIDGVRQLAALGDVYLITSRPASAREDTLAWVAYHRLPVCGISILANGDRKSDFPMDVFIDDGPHNIQDVIDNTYANAYLWDRAWNKDFVPAQNRVPLMYKRVHGWDELLKEFK